MSFRRRSEGSGVIAAVAAAAGQSYLGVISSEIFRFFSQKAVLRFQGISETFENRKPPAIMNPAWICHGQSSSEIISWIRRSALGPIDLDQEWHDWTGLPFVYTVGAVREEARRRGLEWGMARELKRDCHNQAHPR